MFNFETKPRNCSPDEALQLLKDGNIRFVNMKREMSKSVVPSEREKLMHGQNPYAAILCCSDSRVPPEIIFDEGLGKLFIVRVAGNILSPVVMGSLEYVVTQTGCSHILVLGHESCGAVATAEKCRCAGLKSSGHPHIDSVITHILDVMEEHKDVTDTDKIAKLNVKKISGELYDSSALIKEMVDKGLVSISTGYYNLESGEVDFY